MDIRFTKSDAYIVALFFVIAIPVTFSGYDYSKGLLRPSLDTLVYSVLTFFVSYITVYKFFPKYFPEKQIVRLFFWTVIFMTVLGIIEILLYAAIKGTDLTKYWRYELPFWGISTSAQNAGILIGILLGKKFYDAQLVIQKREKEKRENELRLLKSQIDPHFLFNNLNAIDSLIDSNPEKAKLYLSKLSTIYRYLITTKDDDVVQLEEELHFTKEYIYLLEQRFGAAYKFEIEIKTDIEKYMIPPGALQTLVENVVKHNQGDHNNPIITIITVDKAFIAVSNNQVAKLKKQESFGIGIQNLKSRYTLLTDKPLSLSEGNQFSVKLPQIEIVS